MDPLPPLGRANLARAFAVIRRFASFLIRWRIPVGLAALALVATCAWNLRHVELDLSLDPILRADEEGLRRTAELYEEIEVQDRRVIASVEWPRRIRAAELQDLEALTTAVETELGYADAMSLARLQTLDTRRPFPELHPFPELVGDGTALDVALEHRLLVGRLISLDGRGATVTFNTRVAHETVRARFTELVTRICGAEAAPHFVGPDFVEGAMRDFIVHDTTQTVVLESIVLGLLLPFLFRSLRGSLIPLVATLAAVIFNLGLMVLFDWPITLLGTAVPGLIVILGLCDSAHMFQRFEEALRAGDDWNEAILRMTERVGLACFYTSFTTGVGFFSLIAGDHPAVREFAVRAAIAVFVTFGTVIVLLPVLLALWPARRPSREGLRWVTSVGIGRFWPTLTLGLVLTALAFSGVLMLRVDSRWLEELPDDHSAVHDLQWFEENFGGILPLEVRIEGELLAPEVVAAIDRLQTAFVGRGGITVAESYTDWIYEILGATGPLDAEDIESAVTSLDSISGAFPHHVVDEDFTIGRIEFRTRDLGTRTLTKVKEELELAIADLPPNVRAEPTGTLLVAFESAELVVTTMVRSFVLSLIAITLFSALIYRSLRVGLLSMLPNVFPLLMAFGLTGWLGIPLRVGIVMIYSLGLGLAVDDTIHFLTRFREERKRDPNGSVRDALARTLRTTGRVIVLTSALLTAGALCYLATSFRSMFDVGIILTTIVVTALVGDLFLLPPIIERFLGGRQGATARSTSPIDDGHDDGSGDLTGKS